MSVILLYTGIIVMIIGCIMVGYSFILFDEDKHKKIEKYLLFVGIPVSCIGWLLMILSVISILCR